MSSVRTDRVSVLPPPGWYEDPTCSSVVRYWDGSSWSPDQVRTAPSARSAPTLAHPSVEPWPPAPADPEREATDAVISGPGGTDTDCGYRIIETPAPPRPLWQETPTDITGPGAGAEDRAPQPGRDGTAAPETAGASPTQPRQSHVRILALSVLVAALLVGLIAYMTTRPSSSSAHASSGAAPTAAPPPVPTGFHLNPIPAAGLSLAVRDTWLALDPTSSAFKSAVQRAAAANPAQAAMLQQYGSNPSSVKFFAADASNPVYASNVQVTVLGLSKAVLSDPTGAQAALRGSIPNAEVHPATIAGSRGLAMTGTLSFKLPNGTPVTMHATGYFVATSAGVVSIDFATADTGAQDADVQASISSLRLR